MQERIQQLFDVCAKLEKDHPQVISLMNDILGYVDGNLLECEGVIETKVIALSKAIVVNKPLSEN